ncbi:MAG: response regulator transcription factor [Candidatus Gastranaerophilaceae bacterium]|jgi:DNA-binding NarL/FixJ family response regulator|nr:DNA-binding response regulator [bacterium]MEE0496656.1 response regulator transcription factor [Cyanobacteriota bacterium]CDE91333.1 two component transcriptional regulator LuxR family [Fusobacterium sp. CAG:815]DAA92487.1 MAG TPA: DNA-binding response regulator [Candidatus Gastranaerophilales bacterium HUM_7]DAA92739.1 MAG TPA: DNA-binding response regulator [Candidatus Gastranaerophilales bacterium HUM_6]DAB02710.1 MAG TPA: DNA-binding response regulator [Candidatus Gastranaerophilales ba
MIKKNLLIVEDHELTRFGLKTAFEDVDYIGVIYEAATAENALEIFKNNQIDLVIMDLGLPNMNGIDATKVIHDMNKDAKIIILTSHNDEKEVLNSLKAGANAYCSKEINLQRLVQVVQSVADGAAWFDPSIAHIVLQATTNTKMNTEPDTSYKNYDLTAREAQILKLMTEGFSNMEIAQHLVISVNTTKAHVASILQKLEVDDRLQAALKALKYQIV